MSTETALADQFAKYGDLIVGFIVLQSISFGYTLGQKNDLREAIVAGKRVILPIIIASVFVYGGLILVCAHYENLLRVADSQSDAALSSAKAAAWGRIFIEGMASLIAWGGLYLNKPSTK